MLRRAGWCFLALLLAVPGATAMPDYFEAPVLADPADYSPNRGLDLVTLGHWTTFFYDAEKGERRGLFLNLCVGVVNLPDMVAVQGRVHVFMTADGTQREYWADVGAIGAKVVVTGRNTNATANQTSVTFHLPFNVTGLERGMAVTGIFAATSTIPAGAQRIFHDVMPFDNEDRPVVQLEPPNERGSLVIAAPFPFVTLEPQTPLDQPSVLGAPTRFGVLATPAQGLRSDVVRFFPAVTDGWNFTSTYEFLPQFGEQPREQAFTLERKNATVGEVGRASIEVISNSGSYEVIELTARVVSPLAPNESRFEFLPSDAKVGRETTLEIRVLDDAGSAAANIPLRFDLSQGDGPALTGEATSGAEGLARWSVTFDRPGTWTLRASILSEAPSPFADFAIEVKPISTASPPTSLVLGALGLAAMLRTRRRG